MIALNMDCITTFSIQVLVNREPTNTFYPTREIRQGHLLFLHLFVLCTEHLTQLINKQVNNKVRRPIQTSKNGPMFSHLLFANDMLIFAVAMMEQVQIIK